MAVDPEIIPVIAVETVLGAEPHESPPVLVNAVDGALGKAVFDGQAIEMKRYVIPGRQRRNTYGQYQRQQPDAVEIP